MIRLLKAAAALLCAFGLTSLVHAQMTTVTFSKIYMGGVLIPAGTVTLAPVYSNGQPATFSQGGGGLNGPMAFSCTITAGASAGNCQVPDACLTTPANIFYQIQITSTAASRSFTLQSVPGVCGSTWPLDTYGPPVQNSNVQQVQSSYGTGAPPDPCIMPSFYTRNSNGGELYVCVAGHPVLITTAGGSSISLTTNESSGPATLVGGILNVPVYAGSVLDAAAMAAAMAAQAGCATAGNVWVPASNTCVQSSAADATARSAATAAQTTANTAVANAAAAQSTANTGVANASTAQTAANTAVSRTSQVVKYTSALGGVPAINGILSGASAIGATDNAPALNAVTAGGNIQLIVDQPLAANTTLLLGSNTEVKCLPGMGFILMPNTNLPMFQNSTAVSNPASCSATTSDGVGDGGFVASNFCQSNIKITGCYLNANNTQSVTNADHKTGLTGLWTTTVQMLGVQGLELSGNTVVNSPAYNFASNNVDTYRVHDNVITASLGFGSNTDGIHLNGPMSNVWIENNKIAVGDDSIALNADDGYKPMGGVAPTPAVAFPGWTWGAITDVTMDHNHLVGSAEGIRLLSTKSLIDHINIYNTWGTVQESGLNIGHFVYSEGQGNINRVKVDGFDVASAGTLVGLSLGSTIYLQDSIRSLFLNNLTMSPAATTNPFIKLQALGTVPGVISINGLNIDNSTGTQNTTSLIQTVSPSTILNNLILSNVNWTDGFGNTGALVGGGQVPNSLTVSGFAGSRARLLASGYVPRMVYGDGYIPTTTYVSTTFNEGAAAAALNGTVPVTTVAGAAWVNTAGGWLYQSGGGLKSNGVASSFATVNIGQSTNYAIYAKRAATAGQTGYQTVFRFQDASNYDVVNFASGAFVIVDVKAGVSRSEATGTCTVDMGENTAVVSVVGNFVTASVPGCSVSATMPTDSAVLTATNVGFDSSTTSTTIALTSFVVSNQ